MVLETTVSTDGYHAHLRVFIARPNPIQAYLCLTADIYPYIRPMTVLH